MHNGRLDRLATHFGSRTSLLLGFSVSSLSWNFVFLLSACLRDIALMEAANIFVCSEVMACSCCSFRLSIVCWYLFSLQWVTMISSFIIFQPLCWAIFQPAVQFIGGLYLTLVGCASCYKYLCKKIVVPWCRFALVLSDLGLYPHQY